MKLHITSTIALAALLTLPAASAQVPAILNYQGRVSIGGSNYNGTGLFKFALVNSNGTETFWNNAGAVTTNEPANAVSLGVTQGLYSVLVGDTSLGNMASIPQNVFTNNDLRLRVWFSPGPDGIFMPFSPDQRLAAAAYAMRAAAADNANPTNISGNLTVSGTLTAGKLIGGSNNVASGTNATVAGGEGNTTFGTYATVGGGYLNSASTNYATVGGGNTNTASGNSATIGGGLQNTASGNSATIGGGWNNNASNSFASIGGGLFNTASGNSATIGGGSGNQAGDWATVGGGEQNTASAFHSTVSGGYNNSARGNQATVGAGFANVASGDKSMVGGGSQNTAITNFATIAGGFSNSATRDYAMVGGGGNNTASGFASIVSGGTKNTAGSDWAIVSGGFQNTNNGRAGFIGGGSNNSIPAGASNAVVGGGSGNTASGFATTVGGGDNNTASGAYATVPGGTRSRATNSGAFVWSGVSAVDTVSTNSDSFTVRAPGGARFLSTSATNDFVGVILTNAATAWASLSDSNSKTDFETVKPREILAKVAGLPVTAWHYKHDPTRRYIGPMSQDFRAAFGLGSDDKTISTLDSDGVMYAAIQGLVEELHARDARIERLENELKEIRRELGNLPPSP